MKNEWKFIGIYLGAESGRCVAAILKNNKIILNEVHRFNTLCFKSETGFHWDVLTIFQEIITGLTIAQKEFGPDFDGIGVDTWGVDYVPVDQAGRVLGYPYHYRDSRTDGMMEEAFKIIPKETLYNKTGNQPAQYNTLFQLLAEKKQKLNLLNIADKILLMPDFFNFMLCGVLKSEYTIASTTNLTDPYTRNWSKELIQLFDLPENIFPGMIEPGERLGTFLPSISKKTGLNADIPVFTVAGHDTASAVAAIPASDCNWAFLSSGTWSLMGIETQEPIITSKGLNCNFTIEGGVNGTTQLLKNIIGHWPVQECRRSWQDKGKEYSYSELTELAKGESYCGAWVDLNNPEFLKSGEMPEKIINYLQKTNQKFKTDEGFIIRVILESLAFSYRKTIKEIEEITGTNIEQLYIVGGGIKNELLTQLTADATGKIVLAGPIEGAIIGNIGIQAIAAGAIPDIQTLRNITADSFEVKTYTPADKDYFSLNENEFEKIISHVRA